MTILTGGVSCSVFGAYLDCTRSGQRGNGEDVDNVVAGVALVLKEFALEGCEYVLELDKEIVDAEIGRDSDP